MTWQKTIISAIIEEDIDELDFAATRKNTDIGKTTINCVSLRFLSKKLNKPG
jgi:hypothetical protein